MNEEECSEMQKNVPLLATVSQPDLDQLLAKQGVLVKTCAAGELIHLAGERCDRIDVILDGRVMIEHNEADGRFLVITQLGPGDLIGGQVIFSARPFYPMTLTAGQPTRILSISRPDLLDLMRSQDAFL
ncbi:MAG: cyclic nucleotide-binding domain-containing protein, partial [Bacillota bacterium]|nr:cyclic nucleotide-binding domain-containing protein [Bacillota bacterium]